MIHIGEVTGLAGRRLHDFRKAAERVSAVRHLCE
jgi:hypothetical protein